MNQVAIAAAECAALCVGMIVLTVAGHRLGRRRLLSAAEGEEPFGSGSIDAAVFALLGLMIAFNFSGAYGRYHARRQIIVNETNAIGTAYLRLDLLPAGVQPALREKFRSYVDSRIAFYHNLDDRAKALAELATTAALQNEIWASAVAATAGTEQSSARMLLLPALNAMIDITTTRTMAVQAHPPGLILEMLFILALVCAGLTGFGMAKVERPSLLHVVGFAVITAFTIYVILDIEYPRFGLIRLDTANELLLQLRASFGP